MTPLPFPIRPAGAPLAALAALGLALPAAASAQTEPAPAASVSALLVAAPAAGAEKIHRVRARVRHTTVIALPPEERILDFVVGDSEYWHLTGAANVAFLKPLAEGARTNVALICESGAIHSFVVAEGADKPPHLIVRVARGGDAQATGADGRADEPRRPAFVAADEVAAYRRMASEANAAARRAREDAEARAQAAEASAQARIDEFRAAYPERLAFEYRLPAGAARRPFLIDAMWHDGRFTYLRSRARESPALYERQDGEPSLVAYDLTEDGLYVARRVLGDGWLQIGDRRMAWRFDPDDGLR